ncbi:hypothetical protein [Parasphingorhabdus sp.]|uniref:hypothetical protein n=1 Tax=Parasphingorhabdus sp. TaxID=2709688 RepID=UPI003593F55B
MVTGLDYALILMGCSDDMTMCTNAVRDRNIRAMLRECEKAQSDALQSDIALESDYPVVATRCMAGGENFAETGVADIG